MMTPALVTARKAAHGLNQLIGELGLGNLGERFLGDNPEDWAVVDEGEVKCLKYGKHVADVYFYGTDRLTIEIVVPDLYMLVRQQHIRDFQPQDYGMAVQTAHDIFGYKIDPDIRAEWELPDDIPLDGPRRYTPPSTMGRKPVVKGSLNQ